MLHILLDNVSVRVYLCMYAPLCNQSFVGSSYSSLCCHLLTEEAESLEVSAVPYQTILAATADFSPRPLAEGGHKLGEGGSGEVFHCSLSISGSQERIEIAVKVLRRDPEVHTS